MISSFRNKGQVCARNQCTCMRPCTDVKLKLEWEKYVRIKRYFTIQNFKVAYILITAIPNSLSISCFGIRGVCKSCQLK